jgi:hypothetical protein
MWETRYTNADGQTEVCKADSSFQSAVVVLLDRIASVLERYVDNRQ